MTSHAPKRDKSKDLKLLGSTIAGKYKLLEVLGQGGFGSVFLVEVATGMLGTRLALKLLPIELSGDAKAKTRFINEINLAMRMVDKYIVQVRDLGETETGQLYYTMDYCPGQNLGELLRKEERLPPLRAIRIVLRILRALKTAHRANVIHCDLKPANVMVFLDQGQETVRVLDFGIATAVRGDEERTGFAGSPHYMPPEQFATQKLGFYTDTYAVGVILYECLTGQKPYHGKTAKEIYLDQKSRPAVPPEELNPEIKAYPGLNALVTRALDRHPDLRFQDARQFFDELQAVVEEKKPPAAVIPEVSSFGILPVETARAAPAPERTPLPATPLLATPLPTTVLPGTVLPTTGPRPAPAGGVRRKSPIRLLAAAAAVIVAAALVFTYREKLFVSHEPAARPVEEAVKAATREAPVAAIDHLAVARREKAKGRWAEAKKAALAAAEIDPQNPQPYLIQGEAELELGNPPAALRSFGNAHRRLMAAAVPFLDRNLCLRIVGLFNGLKNPDQEAKDVDAAARKALLTQPLHPDSTPRLLELLDARGSQEEVLSLLKLALEVGLSGTIIEDLNRKYVLAPRERLVTRAKELVASLQESLKAGRPQDVIEKAEEGHALAPPPEMPLFPSDVWRLKGLAQIQLGMASEALRSFAESWTRLPPEVPPSPILLAGIVKAHCSLAGAGATSAQDKEKTAELYQRALKRLESAPLELDEAKRLAALLEEKGRLGELVRLLRSSSYQKLGDPQLKALKEKWFEERPREEEKQAQEILAQMQKAFKELDLPRVLDLAQKGGALRPIPELELPLASVFRKIELLRVRGLLEKGDPKDARQHLDGIEKQLVDAEEKAEAGILLARTEVDRIEQGSRRSLDEAFARLKTVIEALSPKAPSHRPSRDLLAEALTHRAKCFAVQNNLVRCEEDIRAAIKLREGEPSLLYHQGESYYLLAQAASEGEPRKSTAEKAIFRFFKLYNDNKDSAVARKVPRGLHHFGVCYHWAEKHQKALGCFDEAEAAGLKDDPRLYESWGDAYAALARAHNSKDYYAKAAMTYRKGYEVKATPGGAKKAIRSYLQAGQERPARDLVAKAILLFSRDGELLELQTHLKGK